MAKIFVLDTSVLLFDHSAMDHFEDNDVVIPITVLEELDNFKIGNETKKLRGSFCYPVFRYPIGGR
jgi:PhoH-like ATPase